MPFRKLNIKSYKELQHEKDKKKNERNDNNNEDDYLNFQVVDKNYARQVPARINKLERNTNKNPTNFLSFFLSVRSNYLLKKETAKKLIS